jgi:Carboxypeptidase regulatory-like domain
VKGIIRLLIVLLALASTTFYSSLAYGQGGATGAISGTVTDANGSVVPGANVQIFSASTDQLARRLTSGPDGVFLATLLPPGSYYVLVDRPGFAEARVNEIEVRVTETTRLSVALKLGTVSEKVEITADVATVDTTNATTGQSIDSNTVRSLPLATQNFQQLLTLSAGVQSDLNNSTQLGRGDVRIKVNGQREDNNNYLIEGISATDYNVAELTNTPLPNPDVIQEFKVQTSLYDATQGRNGGGNINAILKSGTRVFHGDAYEFFRNTALNANDYFLNSQGQDRPVLKQNIFGGSLGGPLGPEKLGFFFINYQGTRQTSGLSPGTFISTEIPSLPSSRDADTLAATFSSPAQGLCPALPLSPSQIDPVVLNLLNAKGTQFGNGPGGFLVPSVGNNPGISYVQTSDPNQAGFCQPTVNLAPLAVSRAGTFNDDQFTTNWDKEFNGGTDKISARFFYSNSQTFEPFGAGGLTASLGGSIAASDLNFPYTLPVRDRFFGLTETHLFSTAIVNEVRFGIVHINNAAINSAPAGATINGQPFNVTTAGINRPTSNLTDSIYKFDLVSSGFQIGPTPQANTSNIQNNYDVVDTISWVHGSHIFRFGGEITFVNLDKQFPQVFNGQVFFASTAANGPLSPTIPTTDWQNFLVGAPEFSFGGGGVYNHNYKQNNFAVFFQDDWKVTKDLTLNLGLRTEILGAWIDGACHIGNVQSSLTLQGENPFVYPGCVNNLGVSGFTGTAQASTFNNQYSTGVGPRVGFAYNLFGDNKTTIRGGYGIYYVREDVGAVDQLSFQTPFLPIVAAGSGQLGLTNFFAPCAASNPKPYSPYCDPVTGLNPPGSVNPNALPAAGLLSNAFLPCLSVLQGFVVNGTNTPTNDSTQSPVYANQAGCNGIPSVNDFALEVPRNFKVPNTQQWNLSVQRDLGKQWLLEVGYVGTHAIHLRETSDAIQSQDASADKPVTVTDVNGASYQITQNTYSNAIARTPTPGLNGYAGYQLFANNAYSHYNSLQTTLTRRWKAGYLQAAYTWSKSTDATSTGNTAFNTAYNDQSNINASRGLSDFDVPQRLVISYVYDLPFFQDASGFKGHVLGGWEVSGVTIFQSGLPFSIIDSGAGTAFLGAGSTPLLGAELAPGATISDGYTHGSTAARLNGWVNINNFTPVPILAANQAACNGGDTNYCVTGFGNLGRNVYRGPSQQNWDFSIIKNFKITERQALRFTADFFNLWNHANFANPVSTDVESPGNFGVITSTKGVPRLIQFSLRFSF